MSNISTDSQQLTNQFTMHTFCDTGHMDVLFPDESAYAFEEQTFLHRLCRICHRYISMQPNFYDLSDDWLDLFADGMFWSIFDICFKKAMNQMH